MVAGPGAAPALWIPQVFAWTEPATSGLKGPPLGPSSRIGSWHPAGGPSTGVLQEVPGTPLKGALSTWASGWQGVGSINTPGNHRDLIQWDASLNIKTGFQKTHIWLYTEPGSVHSEYFCNIGITSAPYFSSLSSVTPSIWSKTSGSEDNDSVHEHKSRNLNYHQ